MKSMHFVSMRSTLTELRRQTGKVLSALHRNKTVHLTEHGTVVADLVPRKAPINAGEFAKLWRQRRPLGKEAADEVFGNIQELRKAEASDALPD
jgi:antitoxin (DNA-binding transcriptional repressor) of toxin-antitoxin stability system